MEVIFNLLILLLWLFCGMFSFFGMCYVKMIGSEYDENFIYNRLTQFWMFTIFGFLSIVVLILIILEKFVKWDKISNNLNKKLYKLANKNKRRKVNENRSKNGGIKCQN